MSNFISIYDLEQKYKDKILNNENISSIIPINTNYTISLRLNPFDFNLKFFYEYFECFNDNGYVISNRNLKQHISTIQNKPYYRQLMKIELSNSQMELIENFPEN
jgi:hypothetical protein